MSRNDESATTLAHSPTTGQDVSRQRPRRRALLLVAGLAVVGAIALLGLAWGSLTMPAATVAAMFWRRLAGVTSAAPWSDAWETVIFDIRLPRIILAALVGASLSQAGAVYQGLFRNPLADPYLIGVSSGAGLGATAAISSGLSVRWGGLSAVSLLAFLGALAATLLVHSLSQIGGRTSAATLVLAGVAVGAFLSSLTTLLMFRARDAFRAISALGWMMGSFALANWAKVRLMAPVLVLGVAILWPYAYRLNVLQLDDDQARQLGVPVARTRLVLIVATTLVTAVAVSVSGVVGFVGLIVPHAVRLAWGPDHRFLLPMGALVGAAFLILADGLARSLLSTELPVGVVTAFCGAPFFLYLLRARRQSIH